MQKMEVEKLSSERRKTVTPTRRLKLKLSGLTDPTVHIDKIYQ